MKKIFLTFLILYSINLIAQTDSSKLKGICAEYSLHSSHYIAGVFPSIRIGYQFKKHLILVGPFIPKYVTGGLLSYQYFPNINKSVFKLYAGLDFSVSKVNFIRTEEQRLNNDHRYSTGILITGGSGIRLRFLKYLYLDWFMGLGYLKYHWLQDSKLNNFYNSYSENNVDVSIKLSLGLKL